MARHFSNWLKAFEEYSADSFVPPQFNTWAGLSVIAGALERKTWLPWNDSYAFYPNIYVLLVSMPGAGKSVALNRAVGLLQEMNLKTNTLNIMPNQATEAKFIEMVGNGRPFSVGTVMTYQNAAYYFASEASNSLRNVFGDFIACLTDFYDCPNYWSRATKKDGNPIVLKNVCVNLLAGSTFDYLGKLISDDNIMGGFASRPIYVMHRAKMVREQDFQNGGLADQEEAAMRKNYRKCLIEDLAEIHKMIGPMRGDADFGAAWKAWWPTFEEKRQSYGSEKLQSLMVRTNTNVLKVAMILSAAESEDRILKLRHWEQALALVEKVNEELPIIFKESRLNGSDKSAKNIPLGIFHLIEQHPGITAEDLGGRLTALGFRPHEVRSALDSLIAGGQIGRGASSGQGIALKVLGDTNDHF